MNTVINELAQTLRSVRRSAARIGRRLTRKARLKLGVTISLPPFLKIVFDYSADLGAPANDNRRTRGRSA